MFTNFLLCCCHARCCCKNIVIANFNWAIVLSVLIVILFAFASLVVFLYYKYREAELNAYTTYRKEVTGKDSTDTSQTSNK